MKTYFLTIAITILTCISCAKNENDTNNHLLGTWKLTETLVDPGGGGSTFMKVNSSRTLIFNHNGKVIANGLLCGFSIETSSLSIATFDETNATINPNDCQYSPIRYRLNGDTLTLIYPCIEGCLARYRKFF